MVVASGGRAEGGAVGRCWLKGAKLHLGEMNAFWI